MIMPRLTLARAAARAMNVRSRWDYVTWHARQASCRYNNNFLGLDGESKTDCMLERRNESFKMIGVCTTLRLISLM